MRIVSAAFAYFALTFGAGFVLGTFRVLLLVPRLGVRAAELLEMPVMLLVIVLAARFVVARFRLPVGASARLATGMLALALLVAAELGLALALGDGSLRAYIAAKDPVSGAVYALLLVVFAVMPALVGRRLHRARQSGS